MMIALDQIESVRPVRADLTRAYVLMLIEHKRPPPVKLIKQDNKRYPYFIYDGHHRVAAARSIKRKVIKAEIVAMPEVAE